MEEHTGDVHFQREPELTYENTPRRQRSTLSLTDRLSFYRAVATHIIGDPTKHQYIHNAVLAHYLQVFLNNQDPLHHHYLLYNTSNGHTIKTFFGALSCPDLVLCNCQHDFSMSKAVITVISNALQVKLVTSGHDNSFLYEEGPV